MQVCAGPRVTGLSVGPAQFGLELPDGSRHAGITGGVSPALRAQNVAAGQCVRGWVRVPVPKSPDPRYITAQLPGYDEAHWVFPGL